MKTNKFNIKKIVQLLLLISFLNSVNSCNNNDENPSSIYPAEVEILNQYNDIGGNQGSNDSNIIYYLINSVDEYNSISSSFPPNVPIEYSSIDYSLYSLVVIFDVIRPDTSYRFIVEDGIEYENYIKFNYSIQSSEPAFLVQINPFTLIKIAKTTKEIEFELVE